MSHISYSVFEDFRKTGSGGVIEQDSLDIDITCSILQNNHASQYGGSIYITNCKLNIKQTSFSKSYSEAYRDGTTGNTIHQSQTELIISDASTYLCGPSSTQYSDSSIKVSKCLTKVSFLNCSASI